MVDGWRVVILKIWCWVEDFVEVKVGFLIDLLSMI